MKKVLQGATALAAVMIAAPTALAADGWYGRVDAGYSVDGEAKTQRNPATGASFLGGDGALENNWSQGLGIGYAFGNGFRLETELGHRWNEVTTAPGFRSGSDVHAWSAMLNGLVDFNKAGRVQPYLGVGVGLGRLDASLNDPAATQRINDSDTGLAYQGMAGIAFGLTERLALDIGYRYFAIPNMKLTRRSGVGLATVGESDTDYTNQAVSAGLRWAFAAPPPPPPPPLPPPPPAPLPPPPPPVEAPPPPQVCPTDGFKVYFDWDRSNLNQAALDTIDAAVARARACNVAGLDVVGYADTSGSPKYNIGLSERRANIVRDALVARGLPSGIMMTRGVGETDLEKPTRDGVREPLNRRTVVTISFR